MPQGLLFVLSEPATVSLEGFHDWYDHEHAPARAAFDGVAHATRWHALDDTAPAWLATYDVDLAVLERPDYRALREHRSERERSVIAGLSTFERRTYELVHETPASDREPGPVTVAVSLDLPDAAVAEYDAWYTEEHEPLLHRIDGWHRTRRYRLLDSSVEPAAPRLLALHDIDGPHLFDDPRWVEATSTPRRDALMARVARRERRVFAVHRRF